MSLKKYQKMRDFSLTKEPKGQKIGKSRLNHLIFVVQKHHARKLHYDFRLEFAGTLKSWAVPKGPSLNPQDKRLAVQTEDHPVEYASFQGQIPKGEYGAGDVEIWDRGIWVPKEKTQAGIQRAIEKGRLEFSLKGEKLSGVWVLIRTKGFKGKSESWLLMKKKDFAARSQGSVTQQFPEKVSKKIHQPPPRFVKPQLAQLVSEVPTHGDWIHELKYDGYRSLCRIENKKVQFLTRSGLDWTKRYGELSKEAMEIPAKDALLDGEIVWVDDQGVGQFSELQNALSEKRTNRLVYYVFDLLHFNGEDLRPLPLIDRKRVLEQLLKGLPRGSKIIYSSHVKSGGIPLLQNICQLKMEGLVSKDATRPYQSGRGSYWRKTKCSLRQEFIIAGYKKSNAKGRPFASLLTGVYQDKDLIYTGRVGTGFTEENMSLLMKKMKPLVISESPFSNYDPDEEGLKWIKPQLVGEIEFKTWTTGKLIRQASFQGLREDKKVQNIHLELPEDKPVATSKGDSEVAGVVITHPERLVYPKTKTQKIEVVKYYEKMFPLMRPYLLDRPLSLLRCTDTSSDKCFFQKHAHSGSLDVRSKPVHYKNKKDDAILAESATEVVGLAQSGALEFHGWGARFAQITQPHLLVFDLDPDTPRQWESVVETAFEIRDMLELLGLKSFVNVTGGKGLHVRVPLRPEYEWDLIKKLSKSLMNLLENKNPDLYTTNPLKVKRKGRIFLDYLRNGYGATAILPFSLRAREKPTVALPVSWKDLKSGVRPDEFLLKDVLLKEKRWKNPWQDFWDLQQDLSFLKKKKIAEEILQA